MSARATGFNDRYELFFHFLYFFLSPQHIHHRETASSGVKDADQVRDDGTPAGRRKTQRPHEPPTGEGHHHQRTAGQSAVEEREHQEVSTLHTTLTH